MIILDTGISWAEDKNVPKAERGVITFYEWLMAVGEESGYGRGNGFLH